MGAHTEPPTQHQAQRPVQIEVPLESTSSSEPKSSSLSAGVAQKGPPSMVPGNTPAPPTSNLFSAEATARLPEPNIFGSMQPAHHDPNLFSMGAKLPETSGMDMFGPVPTAPEPNLFGTPNLPEPNLFGTLPTRGT